jgi:chlorobactene glucosyltransferase
LGKNWACQQLAAQARGQTLLFSDADVRWTPGGLRAVMDTMRRHRADLLTVWPTQVSVTWGERLVVPMMSFVLYSYLPELFVRYLPLRLFAAANGQCLVFSRRAYEKLGGHTVVRDRVLEDVTLAQAAKRAGLRLVMAEGSRQVLARMYTGWPQVRDGFAKNILAGHGGKPFFLLLSAVFHWSLFLAPWLWLAFGWLVERRAWPIAPLAMVALGLGLRLLSAAASDQRLGDAVLLPFSVLLVTIIAARSLYWHYRFGGPLWKGRPIALRPEPKEGAKYA